MIDPTWIIALGCLAVGALCGYAWHAGQLEDARDAGFTAGYAQGRADAITVRHQQTRRVWRERYAVADLEAVMEAANEEMSK